jgi:hypothetical protein
MSGGSIHVDAAALYRLSGVKNIDTADVAEAEAI